MGKNKVPFLNYLLSKQTKSYLYKYQIYHLFQLTFSSRQIGDDLNCLFHHTIFQLSLHFYIVTLTLPTQTAGIGSRLPLSSCLFFNCHTLFLPTFSPSLITHIDWCAFDYNALNHLTMFLFNCHLISNFATLSSPSPSSSSSQTSGVRRTDQNFDLWFSSIRFQVPIFGSNSLPNESRLFVDRSTTADHRKNLQQKIALLRQKYGRHRRYAHGQARRGSCRS